MISLTSKNVEEFLCLDNDTRELTFTDEFLNWLSDYGIRVDIQLNISGMKFQVSCQKIMDGCTIGSRSIIGIDLIFRSEEDEMLFKLTY